MAETIDRPRVSAGRQLRPGSGWAGAASAGLALGLTELFAGLVESVPSALSAVGSVLVDRAPGFVVEAAIRLFGTADKGALAIGSAIVVVALGAGVGRAAVKRPLVASVAFTLVGVVGFLASLGQPGTNAFATAILIGLAALAGDRALRRLVRPAGPVETPADGLPQDPDRRRFIGGVIAAGAGGAVAGLGGRWLIIERSEETRVATAFPAPATTVPPPGPGADLTLPGITPIVVPNDDFYRIDTALLVPRPDALQWRMQVTGMVDRTVELSLDDLLAMDLHEEYVTIACVSNEVGGNLVGNAKWTGVRLEEVLDMAGVRPGAGQIVGRSVDGWTSGFPTEAAFDGRGALIAVGMNDEPLPPSHGFPARLIVPGLYGYVSATKWLSEIELTTWDGFDAYWVPRGWSKIGPIKTQSRIDVPRNGRSVDGSPAVLGGVAWAPLKGIEKVEVQIDDGAWEEAELSDPLSEKAWVQWRFEKLLAPGAYTAMVRATDGTGETQTDIERPPPPDGATGWHSVRFSVAAGE